MLAAIAVGGGCRNNETGSEGAKRPAVGVVQPIERRVVDYAYFTGQIQAVDSVQVRARVTGYLQTICYTPGTVVKKDAVLFEIDPRQYQAQVDLAKGKLSEAESQVLEGKARVTQAAARLELARTKLAIDKEVAKTSGAMSKLTLEEDDAKVKEAAATLDACKATVISLQASVEAAKANLEYNQNNLDWTKVTAPITGRVDRNLLTVGNLVTADVTTLANMVATDEVYAYFDVNELCCLDIQRAMREGAYDEPKDVPIFIALQDEQDFPHKGKLNLVANKFNESTGTLTVRAILKNPTKMLTPGNFVRVRLPVDRPRERLLVPDRAVLYDQGDTFLLIVQADDMVEKRKVTVGSLDPDDKTLRVIKKGLKLGEWVVIQGRQHIRPGVPVTAERLPRRQARRIAEEAAAKKEAAAKNVAGLAMLARFFIDRPIFAWVISIVITLVGGVAAFMLPVAQYPDITPPTVQVSCSYPGANAQVVADSVAAPIEQQVNGVEHMLYMSSQCTNDGAYNLTVTFELGTDLNMAQVLVQNRVALATAQLPQQVQVQGVNVKKKSPSILLCVNLISPDGRYDDLYLSNYATIQIKDELLRIDGVGDIVYLGQRDYSLRMWLDPDKMAAMNLTANDVIRAVQSQNIQAAVGQIGQQPMLPGQLYQLTMSTLGRLENVEQFKDIILKTGEGAEGQSPDSNAVVRIRDVARVELGAQNYDQTCHLDGKPSVALAVFQLPGSNALDVAEQDQEEDGGAEAEVSRRIGIQDRLRHHAVRRAVDPRGVQDAVRGGDPRRDRRAVLPAGLEGDDSADDRRAGLAGRHVRRHGAAGLQPEQPDAVRAGAGHRHRGRRRDRGVGEYRAADRQRPRSAERHDQSDGRNHRPDRRHHVGAHLGVSAGGGVRARHHGSVLPAVCADDRRVDDDLGRQRDDADARPRRGDLQDGGRRRPRNA